MEKRNPTPEGEEPGFTWHAMPMERALHLLDTRPGGLAEEDAERRVAEYGPNLLVAEEGPSLWRQALAQVRSPLIYMLLAAAAVSALGGHLVDAGVILLVVLLNTVAGVVQEYRAEQALEALRLLAAPRARVLRDDEPVVLPAEEVVPGDVLLLEAGDRVAADARVLEAHDLYVDESTLTGESQPVEKFVGETSPTASLADRTNMLWSATNVTGGRGLALVVATGMRTVMGEIAGEVHGTTRSETPLQRRIGQLGTTLGLAAVGLSLIIFLLGVFRGFPVIDMLLFAVAAAVSAIPEGLPAVISIVLALGVQRMAQRHAIIRRLPAVETLGSTTVVCSDKTGTITRNQMTVTRIWAGGKLYRATGEGFTPEGAVTPEGQEASAGEQATLDALLLLGTLSNDAVLVHTSEEGWQVQGDPTEGALLVVARKAGLAPGELRERDPRLAEIPFSSRYQYMATLHRTAGQWRMAVLAKGAPERILGFCTHILQNGRRVPLDHDTRLQILQANREFGEGALRVLAGAYRELGREREMLARSDVEQGLTFVGLWGMIDPPRPEAVRAIAAAQGAGIRVVMITGDHAVTARAIARQVGIARPGDETVSGEELAAMSDETLRQRVGRIAVYARVSPTDKLRIVDAQLCHGQVVAMTGDGVNDAPALKSANIGIAMGRTGTEVAKEAADMVLTDDNFATIIAAVEEGRVIYSNIRKAVFFLVTTNLGEIITLTAALLIGYSALPVTAVMILWVNLVTDGLCTVPLGVEPGHGDVLQQPPRSPRAGILDRNALTRMVILSPIMAIGTLALFSYAGRQGDLAYAQTIAFTTLVAFQWFHAFNARSHRFSIFTLGWASNRWLLGGILLAIGLQLLVLYWPPAEVLFHTVPLSAMDWLRILLVSASILVVDELMKTILRLRRG